MTGVQEIRYRSPWRVGGARIGSHPGTALGGGLEFVGHQSLYARPDARRLDLRASIASTPPDWLVRVNRERAAMTVRLLVDVSASMRFGTPGKMELVAAFVRALGHSAFRVGDSLGLAAFDARERPELRIPGWRHRGMGDVLADMLLACEGGAGGVEGLREAALVLAGRSGIVFLLSDFHWPLAGLDEALDLLAPAYVVPLVVWDTAEVEPPARDGWALLADAESGAARSFWLRPALRTRWRDAVAQRRAELGRVFGARGVRPFYLQGGFDAEALSEHLLEAQA